MQYFWKKLSTNKFIGNFLHGEFIYSFWTEYDTNLQFQMELEARRHEILGEWKLLNTAQLYYRPLWTHHLYKPINSSKAHSIYSIKDNNLGRQTRFLRYQINMLFTCAVDLLSYLSGEPNLISSSCNHKCRDSNLCSCVEFESCRDLGIRL